MLRPLDSLYSWKNLPVVICEAFEAHASFVKACDAEGFQPLPDAHIRSFIGFAFEKGGLDALHWLEEHQFINDDQVIDWEMSLEVDA